MPPLPRIVIDTNVLVAGLRSKQGWSYALLTAAGTGAFEHVVTVPLVMEYEAVLLRPRMVPLKKAAVHDVVDFLCASGIAQEVHFLLRPQLSDANDDMVLEAAVNGGCSAIVTHNIRDFAGALTLGVRAVTPAHFMATIKEKSR
jgi:predicted nucleic acid-binding protein